MTRYLLKFAFVYVMSVITISTARAEETNIASTFGDNHTNIGIAALTVNTVTGTIEDQTVNVKGSDPIFQNEIIETKANSTTQFMFLDETVLTVGPESRLVLDEMFFDPDATKGKVVMSAMKGLFTFVSGTLPSDSYEVKTPTVSIAVRGTKFNLFVARNGASTVVLKSGAVDVKNLRGITRRISKPGLATRVSTRQSAPTKPAIPSAELTELFKPLANPVELKGKSPEKINYAREHVEEESTEIQQVILKKEAEEAAKNKQAPKKAEVKKEPKKKKTKAELAREKKEKKSKKADLKKKPKKKTKAELEREKKKTKKADLKKKPKKKTKKADLKKKPKKSSGKKKVAKGASKKSLKTAPKKKKKKVAVPKKKKKKKIILPKKVKTGVKKAAKVAKGSSKKAAKSAKVASKSAKAASKKAAKSAKAASKAAKKASKRAAIKAKAAAKAAKAASKRAAKKARAQAKKAAAKARLASQLRKKFAFERRLPIKKVVVE